MWIVKEEYTEGMALAVKRIHPIYPYFITVVVAIIFFMIGLYGLSADSKIQRLPFVRQINFLIAVVYLFRGTWELLFDIEWLQASPLLETVYSLIAIFIGLLYLIGGLRKWRSKPLCF